MKRQRGLGRVMLSFLLLGTTLGLGQSACLFKKGKPPEEKVLDVYGTVEEVTTSRLVIQTRKGQQQDFALVDSSIRGGEFKSGDYVHVYYKVKGEVREVTMVVEKID
ncbi:MAG: hypothetical protein JSU96_16010 [Acidobacteriota bacterium]|nr:MAG: hypothetical protein JSU96_16010 [Acidobacteriota bacterium]